MYINASSARESDPELQSEPNEFPRIAHQAKLPRNENTREIAEEERKRARARIRVCWCGWRGRQVDLQLTKYGRILCICATCNLPKSSTEESQMNTDVPYGPPLLFTLVPRFLKGAS